jgi:FKBP-type peptidyl-prolyl cis-trans isomerase
MIRLLCFGFFASLLFSACTGSPGSGYTEAPEGYAYKLLAIGDGRQCATGTGAIVCEAVLRSGHDSIFFNSRYQAPQGFYIRLRESSAASGKQHLANLTEGDSLSLMVGKTCFFREYFDTLVPYFLVHDSVVKLDLKILRVLQADTSHTAVANAQEDRELEELKLIDEYLKHHYPKAKADGYGLYILEHSKTTGETVSVGKRIRVTYSGFYLNGSPLDNGRQQLEFAFGTPDQLVKGLNIVIGNLKKGETTKIIVPSRLAFGETGSTNGSIPPYTPLLYNVTLIDIK